MYGNNGNDHNRRFKNNQSMGNELDYWHPFINLIKPFYITKTFKDKHQ